MKRFLSSNGKRIALGGVLLPLLALFAFAALRSGPLAPVPVTLATVEQRAITPALFGIGTVEARYTHRIGPTFAGRLKSVDVQPGDRVRAGQLLGEIEPIDLDQRVGAQGAALKRAEAGVLAVEAQIQEIGARRSFAEAQTKRYEQLLAARAVSEEAVEIKRQEFQIVQATLSAARANLDASRQELARVRAEREGLIRQRTSLRLVSPVDGIVTQRDADPGSTVVAGQSVVEVVEPGKIWINARFNQQRALGLRAELPAQIVLRSQEGEPLAGVVSRTELHADPVTEETLAKVEFRQLPQTLPAIGELAEVTVALAAHKSMPAVPNASVQRVDGRLGVWLVDGRELRFAPIKTGATDLDGRVQVLEGLRCGEHVVVYSARALSAGSRIKIVERIAGKSS
ncbi:MAG TPA: efflux RND transporter periplasmic adaptor subunit [Paucimonas sp.]|nr:efflux RND transporter periplasmic adaptor subunit [Paucimonas sp.]HJW56993.1 efflux RND transporter periplasmic adaptor subunit [Burkholderiaceae bacterium]